eukprot:CAMPEP_0113673834 /NCGR_PEP_ID=MMETSP0038_2-20120614/7071_1 /TAXON_ID=2898 /ORGANISM="Cryptomonas paramecium" /LENGTH=328 /DNA_ID=CAMNT_0000590323 /DNA_START=292 /DNA_END=1275 /DNA_ORIENTATION=+ /assembly_acc=CAM_ASM_000170
MPLIWCLCFSGVTTPTFSEYALFLVPICLARPATLVYESLTRTDVHHERIYDVLSHHLAFLALGISICWTIHSFRRRAWLLSPRAAPTRTFTRKRAKSGWEWERNLVDEYFSNDDRAMLFPIASSERSQILERARKQPPGIRWHRAQQPVGAGPSGLVYQALCDTTGELLGCKEIQLPGADQERVSSLLRREVMSLSHPNLITYRFAEWRGDTLCLLMEFGDGGCVANVLASYGSLPWKIVRRYTAHVVEGLAYLHRQGIVHDSVKASNCIVCSGGVVKLADYGALGGLAASSGGSEASGDGSDRSCGPTPPSSLGSAAPSGPGSHPS